MWFRFFSLALLTLTLTRATLNAVGPEGAADDSSKHRYKRMRYWKSNARHIKGTPYYIRKHHREASEKIHEITQAKNQLKKQLSEDRRTYRELLKKQDALLADLQQEKKAQLKLSEKLAALELEALLLTSPEKEEEATLLKLQMAFLLPDYPQNKTTEDTLPKNAPQEDSEERKR